MPPTSVPKIDAKFVDPGALAFHMQIPFSCTANCMRIINDSQSFNNQTKMCAIVSLLLSTILFIEYTS